MFTLRIPVKLPRPSEVCKSEKPPSIPRMSLKDWCVPFQQDNGRVRRNAQAKQ